LRHFDLVVFARFGLGLFIDNRWHSQSASQLAVLTIGTIG